MYRWKNTIFLAHLSSARSGILHNNGSSVRTSLRLDGSRMAKDGMRGISTVRDGRAQLLDGSRMAKDGLRGISTVKMRKKCGGP